MPANRSEHCTPGAIRHGPAPLTHCALAVVTNAFVKVYDLSQDLYCPNAALASTPTPPHPLLSFCGCRVGGSGSSRIKLHVNKNERHFSRKVTIVNTPIDWFF